MKFLFLNAVVTSHELLQNAILRMVSSNNTSQKKNRQQLLAEYKKIEYYSDKGRYDVYDSRKQVESTLNLQLRLRVSIKNLQVNHVSNGRFLLCRTIVDCIKIDSLLTLVEDPEGNVERLALNNWILQSDIPKNDLVSVDQIIPVGTQLVIKNPSYNIAADNNTIIRSYNPEDIIIDHDNKLFSDLTWTTTLLEENRDEAIQSADDFRCRGNNFFASNDYTMAIDEYSDGLKLEPRNVTLLANRAEAYLQLCQFGKALSDAEIALKYDPSHLKSAYRKGKALCGLKRYQEAIITLQNLNQIIKFNTDCNIKSIQSVQQSTEKLLKHIDMLTFENKNGQYDYAHIIDELFERAKIREDNKGWVHKLGPRLDHADFIIDDIEIRPVEGKGRGWIAKRDIPENTLLMVSKAFKAVHKFEVPEWILSMVKSDDSDKYYSSICLAELVTCTAQSLMAEPDLCQEIYKLYPGPSFKILEEEKLHLVNIERLTNIIKYNSYELSYDIDNFKAERSRDYQGTGLWILPSYFNHSCVDKNVARFFLGDLMFIRSTRPISKGEELIMTYTPASNSYERRSSYLKSVDIDCQCRLCKLDRSESQKTKLRRAQLLETYEKLVKPKLMCDVSRSLIKELEYIISELRNLRKDHPDLEFDSMELSKFLGFAYYTKKSPIGLKILKEACDHAKSTRLPVPIRMITLDISLFYAKLEKMKEAKKWFDMALKEFVEPVRGKFKDDEINWREEALLLTEKISPGTISSAKTAELIQ